MIAEESPDELLLARLLRPRLSSGPPHREVRRRLRVLPPINVLLEPFVRHKLNAPIALAEEQPGLADVVSEFFKRAGEGGSALRLCSP